MTTLFSSLIRLHALHGGTIPQTQGHFALAAFLDIVTMPLKRRLPEEAMSNEPPVVIRPVVSIVK